MLSDGGPPFGSCGLGRLSRLGVWLARIGVVPILTEPARPGARGAARDPGDGGVASGGAPGAGAVAADGAEAVRRVIEVVDEALG